MTMKIIIVCLVVAVLLKVVAFYHLSQRDKDESLRLKQYGLWSAGSYLFLLPLIVYLVSSYLR